MKLSPVCWRRQRNQLRPILIIHLSAAISKLSSRNSGYPRSLTRAKRLLYYNGRAEQRCCHPGRIVRSTLADKCSRRRAPHIRFYAIPILFEGSPIEPSASWNTERREGLASDELLLLQRYAALARRAARTPRVARPAQDRGSPLKHLAETSPDAMLVADAKGSISSIGTKPRRNYSATHRLEALRLRITTSSQRPAGLRFSRRF